MSFSDENRPIVANLYHSKGEELKAKKANELIKNSLAETVTSVPKPMAMTAGEKICKGRRK